MKGFQVVAIYLTAHRFLPCTLNVAALNLPSSIAADEYLLNFSATRGTAMITSIRADEGTITHTVLDVAKKDDDDESEEDEEMESEN